MCQGAGLTPEEAQAATEAANLAAALRNKVLGRKPVGRVPPPETLGGADLSSEVRWLQLVARFYERSPIVEAVLNSLEQEHAANTEIAKRRLG